MAKKKFLMKIVLVFVTLVYWCPTNLVLADWMNLTGAETAPNITEIYIEDHGVRLVLEAYIEDLEIFHELIPDDLVKNKTRLRPKLTERMQTFSTNTFQFVTENGQKLPADLKVVEMRTRKDRVSPFAGMINPITRQRVPEPPADKRVLYAEIEYPFQVDPRELTIIPPLDDEGRAQLNIGFIAFHKAVPIIDFRYLSGPLRLFLNWEDPWYTKFENPNLKRHHKSALMTYLYIEPYEVRHEVLIRVKDLENWVDLGLRGDRFIEPDELGPLKERVSGFLLGKNPVRVDGEVLPPILDRTDFVRVGLGGIQLLEEKNRLEISTAIVGVIFAYLTKRMPQQVTVDWELFTDQVQMIPATSVDPAGPFPTSLTPEDPIHTWKNFLKDYEAPTVRKVVADSTFTRVSVPLGSILCMALLFPVAWKARGNKHARRSMAPMLALGLVLISAAIMLYPTARISWAKPVALTPELNKRDAEEILHALLKNIYRAFDFRREGDVYDKLALSLNGDLLVDVYVQNRRSFAVQKAGGAQAKVKNIEILNVEPQKLDEEVLAYALKSRWTAKGTVGHWGHVHVRKNLYAAVVRIEVEDEAWKITGLELKDEQRMNPILRASGKTEKSQS